MLKTVTDLRTLMHLAKALGDARKSGDEKRIAEAQRRHDEYRDLCLSSDEMRMGMTYGELLNTNSAT